MPKVCKQYKAPPLQFPYSKVQLYSVKSCRDRALYIYLHFYIIPTLFA